MNLKTLESYILEEKYESITELENILKKNCNLIAYFEEIDINEYNNDSKEIIGKIYNNKLILNNVNEHNRAGYNVNYLTICCLKDFKVYYQSMSFFKRGLDACDICEPNQIHGNGQYLNNGLGSHPLSRCRNNMIHRIRHDPKYTRNGISACDEWLDPIKGLQNFMRDKLLSYKKFEKENPGETVTFDRLNPLDDYYNDTTRWTTYKGQNRNLSTNVFNEETVAICKYEYTVCGFPLNYLTVRHHNINKETMRNAIQDPTESCARWTDIEIPNYDEFIELFINNIDFSRIEAYPDVYLPSLKFNLYIFFKEHLYYSYKTAASYFDTSNSALQTMCSKKRNINNNIIYYKFESYEELLLNMYILRNNINLNKLFNDDMLKISKIKHIKKDYNKFALIFQIRNDYELYKFLLEEIIEKYSSKINAENSNKIIEAIINYKIDPWYKPLKFIITPLRIEI